MGRGGAVGQDPDGPDRSHVQPERRGARAAVVEKGHRPARIAGGVGDVEHAGGGLALVVAQGERAGGGGIGDGAAADGGRVAGDLADLGDRRRDDVGVAELAAAGEVGPGVGVRAAGVLGDRLAVGVGVRALAGDGRAINRRRGRLVGTGGGAFGAAVLGVHGGVRSGFLRPRQRGQTHQRRQDGAHNRTTHLRNSNSPCRSARRRTDIAPQPGLSRGNWCFCT